MAGRSRPELRIGDADRDTAVSLLGEHFVAGRLTKDEYDERVEAAWAARTAGNLSVLFRDLPPVPPPAPAVPPRSARPAGGPRRGPVATWVAGVRILPVFLLLLVLAAATGHWWLVFAAFCWFWWGGLFHARRRVRRHWEQQQRRQAGPGWVR